MPHFRTAVVSMASALALAACSSSDSNGSASLTTPDVPAATSTSGGTDSALIAAVKNDAQGSQASTDVDLFEGDLDNLFQAIADAPDAVADPAALSGSADYAGSLEVGEENDRILGDILMNVDFGNGDVGGTLENLRGLDDNDQPEDLGISVDLTGEVTESRLTATFQDQQDTPDGAVAASGRLEGVFVGDGSEVLGEARIDSVTSGGDESLDGTFYATSN